MQLNILNHTAGSGTIEVADAVFKGAFNEALVHQVVEAYLTGSHIGTKAQKTRAEVRGGGRKPWKQKGTGRARAGSIRSPIWRGGGRTFAAKPRNRVQKINRKMYYAALASIFSELVRQNRLLIIDNVEIAEPKTKLVVSKLADWSVTGNTLIVLDNLEPNIYLASRNLHQVEVIDVNELNPALLVGFEHVVLTVPALRYIEEYLL